MKKQLYEAKIVIVEKENQYAQKQLECQQQLLQAKTNTETMNSNLASIKAQSEAKKADPNLSEATLSLLFPLVYPGRRMEINDDTSTVVNKNDT